MFTKNEVCKFIDEKKDYFTKQSDKIWEYAELGMEEYKSTKLICEILRENGFEVSEGIGGIKTAFKGKYGKGKPEIAILGEYDALADLSQEKANPVKTKFKGNDNGHGCGHNLLGIGALASAIAVKKYLQENNVSGTVVYYGCPGEERGSGKTFMVREGVFDGTDVAFCWHPSSFNSIWTMKTLSTISVYFEFKGTASHAAATPFMGRSALDAVELMNVGVNYLREHIIPDARVHYSIMDPGSKSPNVVQDYAKSYYFIRAPKMEQIQDIYERIQNIAKGATLMTGTDVNVIFEEGLSEYIPNKTLNNVLYENFIDIGTPKFDEKDKKLAMKFIETFDMQNIKSSLGQMSMIYGPQAVVDVESKVLADTIFSVNSKEIVMPGSTDVGDVSKVIPTGQFSVACDAIGTTGHSWQATAQYASSLGHKGMLTAGKVMACAAIDVLNNPQIIEDAKDELFKETKGEYVCPIPKHIKPINQY